MADARTSEEETELAGLIFRVRNYVLWCVSDKYMYTFVEEIQVGYLLLRSTRHVWLDVLVNIGFVYDKVAVFGKLQKMHPVLLQNVTQHHNDSSKIYFLYLSFEYDN